MSFNKKDINKRVAKNSKKFLATLPSINLLRLADSVSINDVSNTDSVPGYDLSTISINNIKKIEIIKTLILLSVVYNVNGDISATPFKKQQMVQI